MTLFLRKKILHPVGISLLILAIATTGFFFHINKAQAAGYTLVAHTKFAPGANGGTSGSIDTTGADFIIIGITQDPGSASNAPTDSKGNTYTGLTAQNSGSIHTRLYYTKNPTVGSGHTFSLSSSASYPAITVAAFSGSDLTAPFDQENGVTANSRANIGSPYTDVTPSANNELIVTFIGADGGSGPAAINSSFTISDEQAFGGGNNYYGAMAYLIQTTAATVGPTWSGGYSNLGVEIATFKAAAAAPPPVFNDTLRISGATVEISGATWRQ